MLFDNYHGDMTKLENADVTKLPPPQRCGEISQLPEKRILVLNAGQQVPDSILRSTAARFWTIVQTPDGTQMSIDDWERNQGKH